MGDPRPEQIDLNGDESVISPRYGEKSLLASERGTDETRRIETDAANNLFVNVAAGSLTPSGTQDVNIISSITLDVLGPLTDAELRASPVEVEIVGSSSSTATRTSPTVTSVVSTVLAANAARLGATLYHDGAGNVFLALGSAATATDFTVRMQPNDYYEVPFGYVGVITAIRSSGTSPLRVTELS